MSLLNRVLQDLEGRHAGPLPIHGGVLHDIHPSRERRPAYLHGVLRMLGFAALCLLAMFAGYALPPLLSPLRISVADAALTALPAASERPDTDVLPAPAEVIDLPGRSLHLARHLGSLQQAHPQVAGTAQPPLARAALPDFGSTDVPAQTWPLAVGVAVPNELADPAEGHPQAVATAHQPPRAALRGLGTADLPTQPALPKVVAAFQNELAARAEVHPQAVATVQWPPARAAVRDPGTADVPAQSSPPMAVAAVPDELTAAAADRELLRQARTPPGDTPPLSPRPVKSKVRDITPEQHARDLYAQALRLIDDDQGKQADRLLIESLDADPRLLASRLLAATRQIQAGHAQAAEVLLERGLALDPAEPHLRMLQALLLESAGHAAQALRLLAADPPAMAELPDYHALYAGLLRRTGNYTKAIEVYQGLVALQPDNSGWLTGLAIALESAGRHAPALDAYRRVAGLPGLNDTLQQFVAARIRSLGAYLSAG